MSHENLLAKKGVIGRQDCGFGVWRAMESYGELEAFLLILNKI